MMRTWRLRSELMETTKRYRLSCGREEPLVENLMFTTKPSILTTVTHGLSRQSVVLYFVPTSVASSLNRFPLGDLAPHPDHAAQGLASLVGETRPVRRPHGAENHGLVAKLKQIKE